MATNNGDGTWTLANDTIAALAESTFEVTATAIDAAGNVGLDATNNELDIVDEIRTQLELGGINNVRSISYYDVDGSLVRINISGKDGHAMLDFVSATSVTTTSTGKGKRVTLSSANGIELDGIELLSDAKGLKISAKGGTIVGSTLAGLTGDFTLGSLSGKATTLISNGIDMAGGIINKIVLGSLTSDVNMGGSADKGIVFKIIHDIDGSNITIGNADVRSFQIGSMNDSSLLVGVTAAVTDANNDGVYDLPALTNLNAGRTISQFKIKGYRNAVGDLFTNSNIGANTIGNVFLRNATLANGGNPFGISSNDLGRLKLRQGRTTYKHDGASWLGRLGLAPDDLTVRLV